MTDPVATDADTTTILGALRRHRNLLLAGFALVGVSALAYRSLLHPPAVAESRVVVEDPRTNASGIGDADPVAYFASQLALARLPVIARQAIAASPAPDTLAVDDLKVTADPAGDTIIFTATLPQGQDSQARALADRLVATYARHSEAARRQDARASLSAVDASLVALQNSPTSLSPGSIALREQLKSQQSALTEASAAGLSVLAISPAQSQPSGVPGGSRLGLTLLLAGSLLALAVVVGADGERRRLKQDEQATAVTGLPILAHLPLARSREAAVTAVWSALTPEEGRLFVLVARHGLDTRRAGRDRLRLHLGAAELPVAHAAGVTVLVTPVQLSRYAGSGLLTSPVVVVAGPSTRATDLRDALAELGRVRLTATGIVWATAAHAVAPAPTRRPRSGAALQRPDAVVRLP